MRTGRKEEESEGRKKEGKNILLPFFFGKTCQFSGFVSKDKSENTNKKSGRFNTFFHLSFISIATHTLYHVEETIYILTMFIVSLFLYCFPDSEEHFLALGDQGTKSK